ncbi:unnamed protein product [Symbiodinium natans]|uniref:Uncharacterized protein n=1 Tax=Symbiodinium natans TaxID=878477 RepID=A0A812KY89_9DINO|nr:unnamed protein product [Symbiodinium natans]
MQECIAIAQHTYIKYVDKPVHVVVATGEHCISDLPLIEVQGKGKKFKEFFHIVENVTPERLTQIREVMCADEIVVGRLPGFVSPGDALGESCHLQLVVDSAANTVLQFFHSSVPLPWGVVKAFCRGGSVKILNYKIATNSDLVKRGFLVTLSKIKGEQWLTQSLQEKLRRPPKNGDMDGNASGGSWDVTPDELREGIAYINKNAPVANSNNEQFLWSLLNERDKESPILGWPLHIVSRACSNRSLGNSQAEAEHFFPLLVPDLNPTIMDRVLPLVVPTMPTHGLMILGRAGIGKTPLAIIVAVARHHLASRNIEGVVVGWRRSKQIDGFRECPGELHIPVILDDTILSSISFEDIKSFLDVGETCLVDARYRAAKFVRNQVKILLNNQWEEDDEPDDLSYRNSISWKQFKKMISSTLGDAPMPHMMAILKRASVIIAGHKGVYVRVASEHQSQTIHRFEGGGVTEDWLTTRASTPSTRMASMPSTVVTRKSCR